MNLDDRDARNVAAGEYVLGTLDRDARRAFEQRLAHDAELLAEVYAWQDRLLPLVQRVEPAPGDVADAWPAIESRLAPHGSTVTTTTSRADPPANDPLWRRLRRWQLTGAAALAASVVLATMLLLRGVPAPERYLAVLQDPTSRAAGWVVEITAGESVRLVPVAAASPVPAGKALQFWTKPEGAAGPTSLGLVAPGRVTELPVTRLPALESRQLFELTLEPETGSPIGRPTGPILYVGSTVRL